MLQKYVIISYRYCKKMTKIHPYYISSKRGGLWYRVTEFSLYYCLQSTAA